MLIIVFTWPTLVEWNYKSNTGWSVWTPPRRAQARAPDSLHSAKKETSAAAAGCNSFGAQSKARSFGCILSICGATWLTMAAIFPLVKSWSTRLQSSPARAVFASSHGGLDIWNAGRPAGRCDRRRRAEPFCLNLNGSNIKPWAFSAHGFIRFYDIGTIV